MCRVTTSTVREDFMRQPNITFGELARWANVSVSTIRRKHRTTIGGRYLWRRGLRGGSPLRIDQQSARKYFETGVPQGEHTKTG